MSETSKRSTASASELGISARELSRLSRPFDPAVLRRARAIAEEFRLVIERDGADGYIGCTVEFPSVLGGGKDLAACVRDTLEATVASIATMLEAGQTPPSPAREAKRDQQLNLRLTADERFRLENAAQAAGFRSVSDFVRSAALRESASRSA